MMMKFNWR